MSLYYKYKKCLVLARKNKCILFLIPLIKKYAIPILLLVFLFIYSYVQLGKRLDQIDPLLSMTFALSLFLGVWFRNIYLRKRYALRYPENERQLYSLDIINLFAMLIFVNVVWIILIYINAIFIQVDAVNIIAREAQESKTIFNQGVAIITLVIVVVTAYYLVAIQGTYNQAKDFLKNLEISMLDIKKEVENLDKQRLLIKKLRNQSIYHLHATLLQNLAFNMKENRDIDKKIKEIADINYYYSNFIKKTMDGDGNYKYCDSDSLSLLKMNVEIMRGFIKKYPELDDLYDALKEPILIIKEYLDYIDKENNYLPEDKDTVYYCIRLIDKITKKI
ncbi:hypothetical protein [Thiofilum flexile]|uniref:hypothetical protein n=1 Tax=Thiofilum flexile TaxID=125627 RepID=UPI0003750DE9|nr:hypothetical protein [Thiofilum flexile]